MGVHSGPVNQIVDVNESANVAGAGINMAQRVMDCGDAGHILLSKRMADDLGQYSDWQAYLHDLGETVVKHGVQMHIVNFYKDEIGNPANPKKFKKGGKQYFPLLAVAAALLLFVIGGVLILWSPWKQHGTESNSSNSKSDATTTSASRTLTYSLTVQKMNKDAKTNQYKPLGAPFESTGQEIYGNGWEFHLNITPAEAGSLYLLNEGPGENNTTGYHVLFPTPANNNGVAYLAAGQTMQTKQYFFSEYKGTEKLWIIWSVQPLDELDGIFKDAARNRLVIENPAQINMVRDLLARYDSSKLEVRSDKSKKQTTIKSTYEVLVSLLELQHEQY
jgi:hypothetical protein